MSDQSSILDLASDNTRRSIMVKVSKHIDILNTCQVMCSVSSVDASYRSSAAELPPDCVTPTDALTGLLTMNSSQTMKP